MNCVLNITAAVLQQALLMSMHALLHTDSQPVR